MALLFIPLYIGFSVSVCENIIILELPSFLRGVYKQFSLFSPFHLEAELPFLKKVDLKRTYTWKPLISHIHWNETFFLLWHTCFIGNLRGPTAIPFKSEFLRQIAVTVESNSICMHWNKMNPPCFIGCRFGLGIWLFVYRFILKWGEWNMFNWHFFSLWGRAAG